MDSGPWGLLMGKVWMCVGLSASAKDSWPCDERAYGLLSSSPEKPCRGDGAVPVPPAGHPRAASTLEPRRHRDQEAGRGEAVCAPDRVRISAWAPPCQDGGLAFY